MRLFDALRPLALLLLRAALGIIFIYHGYPMLFGRTHENMLAFNQMGFPAYFSLFAGVIEFFCGCLLIAGLFTRIAGLLIAAEMAVGIIRVHGLLTNPMAVHNYEFPLSLAAGAFLLVCFGAGPISLDHPIFGRGGRAGKSSRKGKSRD